MITDYFFLAIDFPIETYIHIMFNKVIFFQRSKEHVAMLSNEVQLIQETKEQAVLNSEKRFQTENASLQSDYEKANLK